MYRNNWWWPNVWCWTYEGSLHCLEIFYASTCISCRYADEPRWKSMCMAWSELDAVKRNFPNKSMHCAFFSESVKVAFGAECIQVLSQLQKTNFLRYFVTKQGYYFMPAFRIDTLGVVYCKFGRSLVTSLPWSFTQWEAKNLGPCGATTES